MFWCCEHMCGLVQASLARLNDDLARSARQPDAEDTDHEMMNSWFTWALSRYVNGMLANMHALELQCAKLEEAPVPQQGTAAEVAAAKSAEVRCFA